MALLADVPSAGVVCCLCVAGSGLFVTGAARNKPGAGGTALIWSKYQKALATVQARLTQTAAAAAAVVNSQLVQMLQVQMMLFHKIQLLLACCSWLRPCSRWRSRM
jgi:hypothetical protein